LNLFVQTCDQNILKPSYSNDLALNPFDFMVSYCLMIAKAQISIYYPERSLQYLTNIE